MMHMRWFVASLVFLMAGVAGARPVRTHAVGELLLPGGAAPFLIEFAGNFGELTGGGPAIEAWVRLGQPGIDGDLFMATQDASRVERLVAGDDEVVTLWFKTYGSKLTFRWTGEDPSLRFGMGEWLTPRRDGFARIPVSLRPTRLTDERLPLFGPSVVAGDDQPADFAGRWRVDFDSSEDDAVGVFEVDAETGLATGTFLTTTGDYGHLGGRVDGRTLRLSTFDGAHAFLFSAEMLDDGTLAGRFWSGDWWEERWTARRDDGYELPDAFGLTKATGSIERMNDLPFMLLGNWPGAISGPGWRDVTFGDVYESGRPTLVYVFGSWCPNCKDAVELIKQLYRDHRAAGLQVIAIAYEREDGARAVERVRAYAGASGAPWPILIGGLADKDEVANDVPIIDGLRSYPTTIFVDKTGEVRGVYQGFSGPATGEAYETLQRRWGEMVGRIVGE